MSGSLYLIWRQSNLWSKIRNYSPKSDLRRALCPFSLSLKETILIAIKNLAVLLLLSLVLIPSPILLNNVSLSVLQLVLTVPPTIFNLVEDAIVHSTEAAKRKSKTKERERGK